MGGEFDCFCLTKYNSARAAQEIDNRGITAGSVIPIDRRIVHGRQIRGADGILHAHGNPEQQAHLASSVASYLIGVARR